MRKMVIAAMILLLLVPVVIAVSKSYQQIYPSPYIRYARVVPINDTPDYSYAPKGFKGLQGIVGVSVEEPEPLYKGPPKPFGKPRPSRWVATAPLPANYKGLGGTAREHLNVDPRQCQHFGCTAWHNVVGDASTKKFYRCGCENAASIIKENIKCITTPSIAERIGYSWGECYPGESEEPQQYI